MDGQSELAAAPAGAVAVADDWAVAMLEPGVACILDTETVDLHAAICELAVVDAATGQVLLDVLVNPGTPIVAEAAAVHGISDLDVVAAPSLVDVWPTLLEAVGGRAVVAYNCDYDLQVLRLDADRLGLQLGELGDTTRWHCAMEHRRRWLGLEAPVRLDGGHRAVEDCRATRAVLQTMATSAPPAAPVSPKPDPRPQQNNHTTPTDHSQTPIVSASGLALRRRSASAQDPRAWLTGGARGTGDTR